MLCAETLRSQRAGQGNRAVVRRGRDRRPIRAAAHHGVESLERRFLLSLVPNPIVPNTGEANLIQVARQQADQGNTAVLNHFPIPFAVQYSGGSAAPQVVNWHAGSPIRLDVDNSKSTGLGGNDIQVEVDTVVLPTPHLVMTINRLGTGPFATNVQVLFAFPFNSLNNEVLPGGMPNLFMGYQTNAAGGTTGGIAPVSEVITLTPGVLGGTSHLFNLSMATTGASNPLTFKAGEFDGTNTTGVLDAKAIAAYVETPPANINVGVNVSQSALSSLPSTGSIGVTWDATSPSLVTFGYTEDVSTPTAVADYDTTLTFNQMPTHEQLSLSANESAGTITLAHQSNAPVGAITLHTIRKDGLEITGTASGVPTALDVTVGTAGTVVVNTHGSTLGGLTITAQQSGGFVNTSSFLGYNIGYVSLGLTNVPSLTAGYVPSIDQFGVLVTVPGTSIGSVSLLISKDQNVQLPPSGVWSNPNSDVFSLIDNGSTGTAAARIDHIQQATFNLHPASITDIFTLITTAPAPMEAYLRTTPTSHLIAGHDVEITADIDSFPAGSINFTANFPKFSYTLDPSQTIHSAHIFGHIDSTNFDIDAGSLPPVFSFDFDPDSHATIVAQDGHGGSAMVGHIAAHVWDTSGAGLSGSGALFGTPLADGEMRFDQIPSFHATWSNAGSTSVNFTPDVPGFVGGAQLAVSTVKDLTALPVADPSDTDTVKFLDKGTGLEKQLGASAFGISAFSLSTTDSSHQFALHYSANASHLLTVTVNSAFGGRFFPNYSIASGLTFDSIPSSFDFHTDLATSFVYVASDAIASVNLSGSIDDTNDSVNNPTHAQFLAGGLPKNVDFEVHPATDASLTMNASISHVSFGLTNDTAGIFGSPYRMVTATMSDIPAHWKVDWSGGGLVVEAKDAGNAPAPMGVVAATISTSDSPADNANKIMPFQVSGPGGARINYSPYLQAIDGRYFSLGTGAPITLAQINNIYNNAQVLGAGEDHAVARINGGSLDFFDGQFTGFQKVAYQPNTNGGHFEFDAPTPGAHPFLAGVGLDGKFLVAHLDNVPDSAVLDIDLSADNIHFHSNGSAGNLDLYYGPQGMAQDSDTGLRAVMQNTPSDVNITWGFGFPNGSASFKANSPFTLLFLAQDGSNRLVGAARLQELDASYGLDILPLSLDIGTTYGIPTSANLVLFDAHAGIDVGNSGVPVDGFFNLYNMKSGPAALTDPAAPAPAANEYIPELTFMMKNFTKFAIDLKIEVEVFPAFLDLKVVPNATVDGQFTFDIWQNKSIDDTISTPFGDIGYRDPADYTDNTPIQLIPLGAPEFDHHGGLVFSFEGFSPLSDHFDPLA